MVEPCSHGLAMVNSSCSKLSMVNHATMVNVSPRYSANRTRFVIFDGVLFDEIEK